MLVNALLPGQPEDVKKYNDAHWKDLYANGQPGNVGNISGPTDSLFARVLGDVHTDGDLDLLFTRLHDEILGVYQTRANYLARLAAWQAAK